MENSKKLYLFLIVAILITFVLVYIQIENAKKTKNRPQTKSIVENNIINIPLDSKDATLGNPGAEFSMVEFLNFATCDERCQEIHLSLIKFVNENPQKIRLVWKPAPSNAIFVDSNKLSQVTGICANEQNKLFEYINNLFNEKKLKEKNLYNALETSNLSKEKISQCLEENWPYEYIENSYDFYKKTGFKENPTLIINNKKINIFEDINIEELLYKIIYGESE